MSVERGRMTVPTDLACRGFARVQLFVRFVQLSWVGSTNDAGPAHLLEAGYG